MDQAIELPDRLFGKMARQAEKAEKRLQQQGTKYLARIKKEEKKLFKELIKIDSLQAKAVFGNIDSVYGEMDASTANIAKSGGPLQQYYNGRLDSIQTSLRFLSQENMVGKNFQPPKILGSTIGSYTELQQRYTQGTYMEQMITERRQRLVEQLKQSGFGRQLQSYQKQVQYYQQQLRQAKALLEQPDQLAMKLLGYASRLQLFRTFMEKHSAFAAIFPQPNPIEALQTPGSLQTRVALQNQMGGSLGMPNPQPQLQQQVDQAQQQLKGLKDKLSSNSWGSADEMPVAKTNEEKTQRKWKRLELGGNLQSSRATNFFPNTSDLGLTVGYKLNSKSILGIGATYKLGWGRDWHNVKLTHEGIGLRSFLDWRLKGSIWMTGGAELNHFQRIENLGLLKDVDNWQQSAVIGIARKFKVGKMNTDARLLYDFFWHMQVPRTQPILFRIGYTFK